MKTETTVKIMEDIRRFIDYRESAGCNKVSLENIKIWLDRIEAADKEISAENVKLKTALWKIKNRNIEVDTMIGESDAYDCEVVYKYALYDIDKIASAALGQEVSHH